MRKLLMLSGATAMIAVAPSLADAQGRGKGKGHSANAPARVHGPARDVGRSDHWVRGPDGRWVRTDPRLAGHPHGCPPGLANRNPPCVPPGQVNRLFREGQRLPVNYRYYTDYGQIPVDIRNRFGIPTGYRYIYRDNSVYVVDPTTRLVRDIIDLID
jgi:hypothetical protein